MRNTNIAESFLNKFNYEEYANLKENREPLVLKKYISPEEIRENLPKNQGGIGFLFHATDWETLSFSLKNVQKKTPEFEQKLWNTQPFIASPIYLENQILPAQCLWNYG
jgi:lauroyl/myristoyl acyltransferase